MTDEEILSLYFSRSEEAITATQDQYGAYCRTVQPIPDFTEHLTE